MPASSFMYVRNNVIVGIDVCNEKPPGEACDGQPATVYEVPEGATYNVGDTVDAVELKGQLISKRDLIELLFRLSNDVRLLQAQPARTRKAFLKFLGGLT